MTKRAMVTGISGQDGAYLAELLFQQGYHIRGIDISAGALEGFTGEVPRAEDADQPGLSLLAGDIADGEFMREAIHAFLPNEFYNLASQSRPDLSSELIGDTYRANAIAVVQMLEAIRSAPQPIRFFQASTSEIFGNSERAPQNEQTPVRPRNPYGISKAAAHFHTIWCRERFGLFACNGILYNHESPRRGESFVTRKITLAAARIKLGQQKDLTLGSLDAKRDWGFAGDTVRAMHLMLQAKQPDDYVIATGRTNSIRKFLDAAFGAVNLEWEEFVRVDPAFMREENGAPLVGDASKAQRQLNWRPKVSFEQMVRMMVEADLRYAQENPV